MRIYPSFMYYMLIYFLFKLKQSQFNYFFDVSIHDWRNYVHKQEVIFAKSISFQLHGHCIQTPFFALNLPQKQYPSEIYNMDE